METEPGVKLRCSLSCSGVANDNFFFAFSFFVRDFKSNLLYAYIETRKKFLDSSLRKRFFVESAFGIFCFIFFDSSTVNTGGCS